jgi:hypothetical protein
MNRSFKILVKIEQINGHFTQRHTCFSARISNVIGLIIRAKNISNKSLREGISDAMTYLEAVRERIQ